MGIAPPPASSGSGRSRLAQPSTLPRRSRKRPIRPRLDQRRQAPRAVPWQAVSIPGLGPLRARAWFPTMLVACCLLALVYLLQTSGIATTGYDVQNLETQRSDWQLRNEQLRLELAKVQSIRWVESQATTRLGMRPPDQVTWISPDGADAVTTHP